jgi:hypothetical protein
MSRRLWRVGAVALLVAACAAPSTTQVPSSPVAPSRLPSPANTARATPTTQHPHPLPSESPTPYAPAATVSVELSEQVPVTGDPITVTVSAESRGLVPVGLAAATVAFGDGSAASTSGPCTGGGSELHLRHAYQRPGSEDLRVTAATLCDATTAADISVTIAGVTVLPAAPAASASWPTCTTFQLHLAGTTIGAGLGHIGVLITLQNRSPASCQLTGYPGLQLLAPGGLRLPTTVTREEDYLFPAILPHRVALAPGAYAAFDLGYLDNPFGPAANEPYAAACPTVAAAQVVLPSTHQYGTAVVEMTPCNGLLNVSPLFAGRTWISFPADSRPG